MDRSDLSQIIGLTMIFKYLNKILNSPVDPLVEGAWADQYSEQQQDHIRQQYLARWRSAPQQPTPESHPWLFDPCEPPAGWRYDPYYEFWVKLA
jgi:hypothetical protein